MSNTKNFLIAQIEPCQLLEDTIQACIAQRDVNQAIGVQLDELGGLVGQPRNGIGDDEVYRRYIRARITANKSDGAPETIYKIARLVLGDTDHTLEFDNQGNAAYVLRIAGDTLTDAIAADVLAFMRRATAAGVRGILEWTTEDPDDIALWTTQGEWGTALWSSGSD